MALDSSDDLSQRFDESPSFDGTDTSTWQKGREQVEVVRRDDSDVVFLRSKVLEDSDSLSERRSISLCVASRR